MLGHGHRGNDKPSQPSPGRQAMLGHGHRGDDKPSLP